MLVYVSFANNLQAGLAGEQEEACIWKDSRPEPVIGEGTQDLGMGGLRSWINIQVICDCGGVCETNM